MPIAPIIVIHPAQVLTLLTKLDTAQNIVQEDIPVVRIPEPPIGEVKADEVSSSRNGHELVSGLGKDVYKNLFDDCWPVDETPRSFI